MQDSAAASYPPGGDMVKRLSTPETEHDVQPYRYHQGD